MDCVINALFVLWIIFNFDIVIFGSPVSKMSDHSAFEVSNQIRNIRRVAIFNGPFSRKRNSRDSLKKKCPGVNSRHFTFDCFYRWIC